MNVISLKGYLADSESLFVCLRDRGTKTELASPNARKAWRQAQRDVRGLKRAMLCSRAMANDGGGAFRTTSSWPPSTVAAIRTPPMFE
jgi:hypothetical protein